MRIRTSVPALLLAVVVGTAGCGDTSAEPPPDSGTTATAGERTGTTDAPRRRFFHENKPYRLQNSVRGLRRAVELDLEWIDIDSNYCREVEGGALVALATHWARIRGDHFRDPSGSVPEDARWSDLTLAQVRRLRSDDADPTAS
ncbi:hypothetical protein ASE01_03090 [Nocardioides sp. Root190]|uniref:hypothetical protein n=1 Tax=Nocardioides sp. Root190 TaxID=1736488 RepID=UPI0006FAD097|nr:hypothetical protein [Nocardioides sp. Root190]KRB80466.1 hypothetical protein ASE01_03090 [Nocardioides sp. Root190]